MSRLTLASLHHHSTMSFGDGHRLPSEHVQACAELGYEALALTDHGNISGHIKLEKAAKEVGIKPIFGCELYCETKDERGQLKNHLTVLAADNAGYQNLLRLVSESWDNFRYKPTVTSEMLERFSEGLIVLSGCLGGLLATELLGGKGAEERARPDRRAAERVAGWFEDVFEDRYYLEVMPHPILPKQCIHNQELARLSGRTGIPLVATLDCHYPDVADREMYPIIHSIARGGRNATAEAQSQDWEYDLVLAPRAPREIVVDLENTGLSRLSAHEALATTLEIADKCDVEIPKFQELIYQGTREEMRWAENS